MVQGRFEEDPDPVIKVEITLGVSGQLALFGLEPAGQLSPQKRWTVLAGGRELDQFLSCRPLCPQSCGLQSGLMDLLCRCRSRPTFVSFYATPKHLLGSAVGTPGRPAMGRLGTCQMPFHCRSPIRQCHCLFKRRSKGLLCVEESRPQGLKLVQR